MGPVRTVWLLLSVVAAAWIGAGCAGIRIETGQTPEEATASSQDRGRELRRTWAQRFDQADPWGKAGLLKMHIDSSSARFITVGRQFGVEWQEGNRGRGEAISAADFRQVIDNSIAKDRPLLEAWEDNLEYGWDWVRDSSRFDGRTVDLFGEFVEQYYVVYSAVFLPTEDVQVYGSELDRLETETRNMSRELGVELNRYR